VSFLQDENQKNFLVATALLEICLADNPVVKQKKTHCYNDTYKNNLTLLEHYL